MANQEKIVVILNGISRKKKKFYREILPDLSKKYWVDVWETGFRNHAVALGSEAVKLNPMAILAAGGDGTLNQVLNGIIKAAPTWSGGLGVIPLGTGNDFARIDNIKPTAPDIIERIERGGKLTDVGQVTCLNEQGQQSIRHFINVASLGMGPSVVRRLFKSNRSLGPTITYLKAITKTFLSHKPESVEIKADDWIWQGKLRVLAIANGPSFGSGMYIAPKAQPDDGLFNTFLVGKIPLLKFLWFLQLVKSKKKILDHHVQYGFCTKLSLSAPQACWIETEGELAGMLPAKIEIMPKAIKFLR